MLDLAREVKRLQAQLQQYQVRSGKVPHLLVSSTSIDRNALAVCCSCDQEADSSLLSTSQLSQSQTAESAPLNNSTVSVDYSAFDPATQSQGLSQSQSQTVSSNVCEAVCETESRLFVERADSSVHYDLAVSRCSIQMTF